MAKGFEELFIDELQDIYSSEHQILKVLPEMAAAAEAGELKEAFKIHLIETKKQVQRLDKIFDLLKIARIEKFCKGTRGLIQECQDIIKKYSKSPARDAALISKAQRIEHYEISAYGTVHAFAREINLGSTIADLLQSTLGEEAGADKKLTKIAEGGLLRTGINHQAHTVSHAQPHGTTAPKAKKAIKRKAAKRKVATTKRKSAAKKLVGAKLLVKKAKKTAVRRKVAKKLVAKKAVKRVIKKKAIKRVVKKKAVKRKVVRKAASAKRKTTARRKVAVKAKAFSVKKRTAKRKTAAKRRAAKH